jgi:hypothetical protein
MGYWKFVTAMSFFFFCIAPLLFGRDVQAIEETKYEVIEREGNFELDNILPILWLKP